MNTVIMITTVITVTLTTIFSITITSTITSTLTIAVTVTTSTIIMMIVTTVFATLRRIKSDVEALRIASLCFSKVGVPLGPRVIKGLWRPSSGLK